MDKIPVTKEQMKAIECCVNSVVIATEFDVYKFGNEAGKTAEKRNELRDLFEVTDA